jgi:zinc and cadmium transporter
MQLLWIVVGGVAMAAVALVGAVTLLLGERTLGRLLRPLVAFAAGSLGGVMAWAVSARIDTSWLLGLAAGNILYIGASDLVPEVNRDRDLGASVRHMLAFLAGAGLLALLRVVAGR